MYLLLFSLKDGVNASQSQIPLLNVQISQSAFSPSLSYEIHSCQLSQIKYSVVRTTFSFGKVVSNFWISWLCLKGCHHVIRTVFRHLHARWLLRPPPADRAPKRWKNSFVINFRHLIYFCFLFWLFLFIIYFINLIIIIIIVFIHFIFYLLILVLIFLVCYTDLIWSLSNKPTTHTVLNPDSERSLQADSVEGLSTGSWQVAVISLIGTAGCCWFCYLFG